MSQVRAGGPHLRGAPPERRTAEFRWPVHPASVRLARQVVSRLCRWWRTPDASDAAALAVSEMVGNTVRAGAAGDIVLRLDWTPRRLRVEVHDESPGLPRLAEADPLAESGRGMWIISQLAVRWGSQRLPRGKVVWAEIALPSRG